jgi:hypothetical protein
LLRLSMSKYHLTSPFFGAFDWHFLLFYLKMSTDRILNR